MDGTVYEYYESVADGAPVAYAVKSVTSGFGGALTLMVGVTPDGTIYNTSVLSHTETPGLGAKCTTDEGFMAQWKGFDFAVMFQGVAKRKILVDTEAITPFGRTHQMPWTIHRDYWTEDNPDAYWPRLYNYNGDMFNFQPSDKWVQNAAYLRLKNITLGYTIPVDKRYIQKLRVYISGNDVWEKSDILKVFDPEAGNNVGRNYYPFFRTWSFGVNVTL